MHYHMLLIMYNAYHNLPLLSCMSHTVKMFLGSNCPLRFPKCFFELRRPCQLGCHAACSQQKLLEIGAAGQQDGLVGGERSALVDEGEVGAVRGSVTLQMVHE